MEEIGEVCGEVLTSFDEVFNLTNGLLFLKGVTFSETVFVIIGSAKGSNNDARPLHFSLSLFTDASVRRDDSIERLA